MPKLHLRVPSDETLTSTRGWKKVSKHDFGAVQADYVVVQTREKVRKGPPVRVVDVPGGTEYSVQDKRATVIKHTGEIQLSLQKAETSKFVAEAAAKIAAEVGLSGNPLALSAKLSSELQTKIGTELTEMVQETLTEKRSFELQDTREITRSVSYKPAPDGRPRPATTLQFYLNLWPWRWDFYLYRIRFLTLHYEKNWIWPDVRKTIVAGTIEAKRPLFSIRVYEPQDEYSWTDLEYTPDVTDQDLEEIKQYALTTAMPAVRFPLKPTLEDLARDAFPLSGETRRKGAVAPRAKAPARGVKRAPGKTARKTARKRAAKRRR